MFDTTTLEVLSLSLWVATTAVVISLPLALAVAWFLARSRWRGKMVVDAVFNRDYAVVQAVVLVTALGFILMNLLADLAYVALNPRLRTG